MAHSVQHARLHQPQSNRRSTSAITRARPGPVRPPGGTVTALILALSPATWRARVERQPDGSFDYVVQGWPRNGDAAQAVTVLEGVHVPGANENTGSGHWRYDLTAAHGLDPTTQPGTGAMDVDYSLAGPRTLEVGLTDFQQPGDATTNDTLYRYTEAVDGSGTFDFISNLDIDAENDSTRDRRELLQVRSRLADGPGRADVTATHGDLPAGVQVEVNECWDAAFARTYWHFSFPQSEVSDGDAAACPYAEAEYPEFEGFDANAFADGDLVAALPEPGDLPDTPGGMREPASEPALYFVLGLQRWDEHVALTQEACAQQAEDSESRPAADPAKCVSLPKRPADLEIVGDRAEQVALHAAGHEGREIVAAARPRTKLRHRTVGRVRAGRGVVATVPRVAAAMGAEGHIDPEVDQAAVAVVAPGAAVIVDIGGVAAAKRAAVVRLLLARLDEVLRGRGRHTRAPRTDRASDGRGTMLDRDTRAAILRLAAQGHGRKTTRSAACWRASRSRSRRRNARSPSRPIWSGSSCVSVRSSRTMASRPPTRRSPASAAGTASVRRRNNRPGGTTSCPARRCSMTHRRTSSRSEGSTDPPATMPARASAGDQKGFQILTCEGASSRE